MGRTKIAIVGLGKIALDQHLPAIGRSDRFDLAAVVDPRALDCGAPTFASLGELLETGPPVEAVAICTPPQVRHAVAAEALTHGLHVLLEKPPAASVAEGSDLVDIATRRGAALFAAWHSRAAPAVGPAAAWLKGRVPRSVEIVWKEDVRRWHPGQAWIWREGGMGVFDPGINALSILTRLTPGPIRVTSALLEIPANCQTPIAARLEMTGPGGLPILVDFDFRQVGPQTWDISMETDAGKLLLSMGGATMSLDGRVELDEPSREYPALYDHFAALIQARGVDVDLAPLRLVEDALRIGRRRPSEDFAY